MYSHNHALCDDQINSDINVKISDVNQAIKEYDAKKGWFRPVWDQADISKLRTLHKQLSSVKEDRYLNTSESYALFSVLVNNGTVQNSASSIVLQMLEDNNRELVALGRTLKQYDCFNESIFNVLYQRLKYLYAIKTNITSLSADSMKPILEHVEAVCRHTKESDVFLSEVVGKCKTAGMSNGFISDVIAKILDKKLDSYELWNKIRYTDTVNYNELLNVSRSDTSARNSALTRVTQMC